MFGSTPVSFIVGTMTVDRKDTAWFGSKAAQFNETILFPPH